MVVAMVAALAVFFGLEGQVKQNAQAIRYNSERIANQAEDVQRGISALDDRLIRMENKVDDLRQVLLDGLNDMRLRELRNDQGDSSR